MEEFVSLFKRFVISFDISVFSMVLGIFEIGVGFSRDIWVFFEFFFEFFGFLFGVFGTGIVFHVFFNFIFNIFHCALFSRNIRFFGSKDVSQGVNGVHSSSFISVFKGLFNMHFGEFH